MQNDHNDDTIHLTINDTDNGFAPSTKNFRPEDIYYIEDIRDYRIRHGKQEFFLKWQGFIDKEQLWEPESNFFPDFSDFADSLHPYDFLWYGYLTVSGENGTVKSYSKQSPNISVMVVHSNCWCEIDPDKH